MVREVIGGWRAKTVWQLAEAAADGDAAEALRQLDRLLGAGEHPIGLLAQIAWSLRRFASATRIFEDAERRGEPISLRQALEQAGFRKWPPKALEDAERQLRQLGRQRAGAMYQWLLDADLSLKGSHSASDRGRFVLERLILRMAKEAATARTAG
jgi:DNA polymerase III subunit delta